MAAIVDKFSNLHKENELLQLSPSRNLGIAFAKCALLTSTGGQFTLDQRKAGMGEYV